MGISSVATSSTSKTPLKTPLKTPAKEPFTSKTPVKALSKTPSKASSKTPVNNAVTSKKSKKSTCKVSSTSSKTSTNNGNEEEDLEDVHKDSTSTLHELVALNPLQQSILNSESLELEKLLVDYTKSMKLISVFIKSLTCKIENQELKLKNGISFIDIKIRLLFNYNIKLIEYYILKFKSISTNHSDIILELYQLRTYLDKIRPIDLKLKYQIDKLKNSSTIEDPLKYAPNINSLTIDENSDESDNETDISKKTYKPPKFDAVFYDEDQDHARHMKRLAKAANSSHMEELREEMSDMPRLSTIHGVDMPEIDDDQARITAYEEENFTRLQNTNKQKKRQSKMLGASEGRFSTIADAFSDLGGYDPEATDRRPTKKFKPGRRREL